MLQPEAVVLEVVIMASASCLKYAASSVVARAQEYQQSQKLCNLKLCKSIEHGPLSGSRNIRQADPIGPVLV